MNQKSPKKSVNGTSTQSLLKTARIAGERLLVEDKAGVTYVAHRGPHGTVHLVQRGGLWSGFLALDAWSELELAWWEERLEEHTPAREVWLLVSEEGRVVGHLSAPEYAADPRRAHPFRINNSAQRPVPALGDEYAPRAPAVRPPRTRGASGGGDAQVSFS